MSGTGLAGKRSGRWLGTWFAVVLVLGVVVAPVGAAFAVDPQASPTRSPAVGSHLEVRTSEAGSPLVPVTVVAPGVAVYTGELGTREVNVFQAGQGAPYPAPADAAYLAMIQEYIRIMGTNAEGQLILRFLGAAAPLPTRTGGWNSPGVMTFLRGDGFAAGINVVIGMPASQARFATSTPQPASTNGEGAYAIVYFPRVTTVTYSYRGGTLVVPADLALAHELVHAVHAVSGSISTGITQYVAQNISTQQTEVLRTPTEEVRTLGTPEGMAAAGSVLFDWTGHARAALQVGQPTIDAIRLAQARAVQRGDARVPRDPRVDEVVRLRVDAALVSEYRYAVARGVRTRDHYSAFAANATTALPRYSMRLDQVAGIYEAQQVNPEENLTQDGTQPLPLVCPADGGSADIVCTIDATGVVATSAQQALHAALASRTTMSGPAVVGDGAEFVPAEDARCDGAGNVIDYSALVSYPATGNESSLCFELPPKLYMTIKATGAGYGNRVLEPRFWRSGSDVLTRNDVTATSWRPTQLWEMVAGEQDGTWHFKNVGTGYCLTVVSSGGYNLLQTRECPGSEDWGFAVTASAKPHTLITAQSAAHTGKCMDALSENTNEYAQIGVHDCKWSGGANQAFDVRVVTPPPATNVARKSTASQSSNYLPLVAGASVAVDGNTNGSYDSGSVTHTGNDANAWWMTDLGSLQEISSIKIFNRTDCCTARLGSYRVYATEDKPDPTKTPTAQLDRAHTTVAYGPAVTGASATVYRDSEVKARYVMVQFVGKTDYLSLAEVQVFAATPYYTIRPTGTLTTGYLAPTSAATAELEIAPVNLTATPPIQQWEIVPAGDGLFRFINRDTGKCLDAENNAGVDSGAGESSDFTRCDLDHTLWRISGNPTSGGSIIENYTHAGQCLDVSGGNIVPGAAVREWDCNNQTNQSWELEPIL